MDLLSQVNVLHFFFLVLGLQFQLSKSFTNNYHSSQQYYGATNNVDSSFESKSLNRSRDCHKLFGITKSLTAVLDGSSFNALDLFLAAEGKSTTANSSSTARSNNINTNRHGYCSIITGKTLNNERIVGIKVVEPKDSAVTTGMKPLETVTMEGGVEVYKDSIATIPQSVSDDDAISTCIASLAAIHCAIHDPIRPDDKIVKNIGGSSENFVSSVETKVTEKKKAVVVGGSDYASFVADGLAAVGAMVTQVSTGNLRTRQQGNVSITPPAVGEMNIGFSSAIGKFNVLIDTLSDEAKAGESMCIGVDNNWDDFGTGSDEECSSAVIMQLKRQHKCNRYISTLCHAQKMVRDNGLIFGRNDAQQYTKQIGSNPAQSTAHHILPPKHFGTRTLQKLLDSNILFKSKAKEPSWIQGWSLKDYWELTSWPRDVAGAANVRFGFPVVDDLDVLFSSDDDDDADDVGTESSKNSEKMISAPPLNSNTPRPPKTPKDEFLGKENPFIFNIDGVDDLSSQILGKNKKCVLFLSSTSCRTCKYLTPQYTKLSKGFPDDDVVFAKVNAFSKKGKELSKVLGVSAVPAFVFFRDGKRFGTTLSLTRIPSQKMDLALNLLSSGDRWDERGIRKLSR